MDALSLCTPDPNGIYLSICLSVCLSICLSVYLSIYLSIGHFRLKHRPEPTGPWHVNLLLSFRTALPHKKQTRSLIKKY